MNTKYRIFVLFALSFIYALPLAAQEVSLNATVNRTKIGLDQQLEYKIEVSGKSTNLPDPEMPDFADFNILSGPNPSTSIQYVNGRVSSSKSYTFYLQPVKTGKFTIPAASLEVDGEKLSSDEITIEVVKAAQSAQRPGQDIKSRKDAEILGENLYLKAHIDKKTAYINEPLIVTYKLYFRVNIRGFAWEKIPSNPGFWTEEFKLPAEPAVENEIINNIAFRVATLKKIALFPTRSGELTVEPLSVSANALVPRKSRSRSLFDDFFNDPFERTVRTTLTTKPIKANIKALPEKGKPPGFSGAVGSFSFNLTSDKSELRVNEAASIRMTIAGEGNIKLLSLPQLNLPPDMEVYEPKEKTNITREKNSVKGNKAVEYIIVPRFEGDYTIKPIAFSYFDPALAKYNTVYSRAVNLKVLPGTGATGIVSGSSLSRQEVELLGEDIRFIKETASFYTDSVKIYDSWLYRLAYIFPLILLAIAWSYGAQREKLRSNLQLARRRKAGKIASRHLAEAKSAIKSGGEGEFYRKISHALQGFVSDRINIQLTDFNAESAAEKMLSSGVGADEVAEYRDCLLESDFRQYSGSTAGQQEMKAFFEKVKKILTRLEKYI